MRDLIRSKIKEKGLSMSDLSKQVLRRNHAYLQQFLDRGIPAKLPEDMRAALAPALGLSEADLKEPVNRSATRTLHSVPAEVHHVSGDKLKVLGMAECGPDGWSIWNGDIIDWIPRPANLAGAKDAYAVYISGDSMQPRYHAGELAHIHPGKPPTVGSYVLVQKRPAHEGEAPRAVIKRLVRRSGNKITLEQYNPAKTFEIRVDEVVSMHRVVGSGEP